MSATARNRPGKGGLGRGLGALIPSAPAAPPAGADTPTSIAPPPPVEPDTAVDPDEDSITHVSGPIHSLHSA